MHERSLSPMNVEEAEQRLSPLKCSYPPDLLCREPDYKMKCQFLSQMCRLEPVPATTRLCELFPFIKQHVKHILFLGKKNFAACLSVSACDLVQDLETVFLTVNYQQHVEILSEI